MAYMLIIDNGNKNIEIHSDMCDRVFEAKDKSIDGFEFAPFNLFEEVENYLNSIEGYEVLMCEICKPEENKEALDEEYDDFYEEFDDDEEFDGSRCDII